MSRLPSPPGGLVGMLTICAAARGRLPRRLAECDPPAQPRAQQTGQDRRPVRRGPCLRRSSPSTGSGSTPTFRSPATTRSAYNSGKVGWVIFAVLVIVGCHERRQPDRRPGRPGLRDQSAFAFAAFTVIGFYQLRHEVIYRNPASLDEAVMAASLIGACAGFLWWNAAPARIFMGDTGSLGIGAAIGVLALLENVDLLLPLIGGLYVLETLSVIIQVASYPLVRPTGLPHGARTPPLRAGGLAGDDGDRPVLDPGRAVHGPVAGGVLRRLPGPRRHGVMADRGHPRVAPGQALVIGYGVSGRAAAALVGQSRLGRGRPRRRPRRPATHGPGRTAGGRRSVPSRWPRPGQIGGAGPLTRPGRAQPGRPGRPPGFAAAMAAA